MDPLVIIASDGELYGHHQSFRDLFLERLVAPDDPAPDRGFDVVDLATAVAEPDGRPHPEIRIRERTSWSCHHGVLRWFAECPDVAGRPMEGAAAVGAGPARRRHRRGHRAARARPPGPRATSGRRATPTWTWSSGPPSGDAFAAERLGRRAAAADRRRLLELLEAQRWRLAMFASDGWYWDDPSRPETRQVLRSAARAARIVDRLAGTALETRLVADLATLRSPALDVDGGAIYRHALSEVGQPPPAG